MGFMGFMGFARGVFGRQRREDGSAPASTSRCEACPSGRAGVGGFCDLLCTGGTAKPQGNIAEQSGCPLSEAHFFLRSHVA